MTRHWFTTHYPPVPELRDILNIYIQDKYREEFKDIAPGDRVFIYEFDGGPDLIRNGTILRRQRGAGGIICEARVKTHLEARDPAEALETFVGGKKANWLWIAKTDVGSRTKGIKGPLPRLRVNAILGYGKGYTFRGFNSGRGIKLLSPAKYQELLDEFSGT